MNDDFQRAFGREFEVQASAPGRVNLIGEHTDYNGGFVLPLAIPLRTRAAIARRRDRTVRARSLDLPKDQAGGEYELGAERPGRGWLDYVQGLTHILALQGYDLPGFDLLLTSTVPIGRGLSSSASLEIAILRALRESSDLPLDDLKIAMVGHRAETEFVGAPVGIMDQMVSSLGHQNSAFFLDTRSQAFERISIPVGVAVGVIDSGISHRHANGEYRTRRRECEEAAALLGVVHLCQLSNKDLDRIQRLPAPLVRRARHVITENGRVLMAVDALHRADLSALGALFLESHVSMRDDFEVSLPEIDRLVTIAAQQPEVYGARLTGGGFGGAVIVLCDAATAADVALRVTLEYADTTGLTGTVLLPRYGF